MVKTLQRKVRGAPGAAMVMFWGAHTPRVLAMAPSPSRTFPGIATRRRNGHARARALPNQMSVALVSRVMICYKAAVFRLATIALLGIVTHPLFAGGALNGSFTKSGIVFDGSLVPGKSGPAPFANSNYMIPASYGIQKGGNLFQSFSQFDLASTDMATFTGPSLIPNTTIQNILARVTTVGSPSSIDGTINSDIPGANLFFLNPAGVMLGPHARLNVSGSVAISTADYLKLKDGGRFNAKIGDDGMLTSAAVSAFGFLNSAPAAVSIVGSNTVDSFGIPFEKPQLTVAPGKVFSIIAGDITIAASTISSVVPSIDLGFSDLGPRVNLISVRSAGEAQLDPTDLNSPVGVTQFSRMGDIQLIHGTFISTFGLEAIGGPVVMRAGTVSVDNAEIFSDTVSLNFSDTVSLHFSDTVSLNSFRGGAIDISARDSVKFSKGGIETSADFGTSGDVLVKAPSIRLDMSGLGSNGEHAGLPGNIIVRGGDLVILKSGIGVHIGPFETPATPSGNVLLSAKTICIDNSFITVSAMPGSAGGGTVVIHADDLLALRDGTKIDTGGFFFQSAAISLSAPTVIIDGATIASVNSGDFNALANITVNAGDLEITNGGVIDASTTGQGPGGAINVTANSLSIQGPGSKIISQSTGHHVRFLGGTDAATGDGGNINISVAGALKMSSGGVVSASSQSTGTGATGLNAGNAGEITITAGSAELSSGSSISTSAKYLNAGKISLTCEGVIAVTGQSRIDSSAAGTGNGGDISVTGKSISLDTSMISSNADAFATGNAGSVMLRTSDLTIAAGSEISSNTFGRGDGGSVAVTAGSLLIDGLGSGIFAIAKAGSGGKGGDVTVDGGALKLVNGGSISAASFTSAPAGSVILGDKAPISTLTIDSGSSVSSANNGSGAAGSVSIDTTGFMTLSQGSSISTSAHGGNAGDVTVHTAGDLGITQDAEISSSTFGAGTGGDVKVAANSILVEGVGSAISAEAGGGTGSGGQVGISAGSLLMENAGSISTKSLTAAMAGSIRLTLGTLAMESDSSISSANAGTGSAGGVFVSTSGQVKLESGSDISTSSKFADAGSIELLSGRSIRLSSDSSITASAGANGGNIHIKAPNFVNLTDSLIKATAGKQLTKTGKGGTGGNITIDPQFIVLNNTPISANAAAGQGGNISLTSDFFFNSGSPITATGTTNNGTVNIAAPQLDLGAELVTLPTSLVSAANQLQERCTALLQGDFSSFISIGRGGTEPEPDELQEEF